MRPRLLDHVGLVAHELAALRAAWCRLGFAPTEPRPLLGRDADGRAVPLGQSSCHAVFDGGYVELTAVDAGTARHHLDPWRVRGDGCWIVAFGAADAASARERCVAAGLPVTPVMEASRAIDYGARHGAARFRWFMLEPAASSEALLCVVEHRTPELVFQREVTAHPNGSRALRGLVVVVPRPEDAAVGYARLLGVAAAAVPGGVRLGSDAEHVDLLTPAAFAARYPGARWSTVPGAAALRIEVDDAVAARARVDAPSSASVGEGDGFWVDAPACGGVVVEFTAPRAGRHEA